MSCQDAVLCVFYLFDCAKHASCMCCFTLQKEVVNHDGLKKQQQQEAH